jgi:hypothetical protein
MSYSVEVLADSPLGYLRLGEASGTTAADEVGAHAGTYVNTPTLGVAGGVSGGTAVSFDAAQSERVTWTTLGTLGQNIISSAWEFWIKTTTTSQGVILGSFNTGTSLAIQFQLNRSAADAVAVGKTRIFVRGTNGNQLYGEIATNIYDGAWHHVKVTFPSTTTIKVRIDKVDQTITYGLQQAIASTANFGFPVALAARNLRGVFDNVASIALDEVAVYPAGLSDARSDAHYDAAAGTTTVSDTRQLAYDIKNTVAPTRQLAYDIKNTVTAERQLAYNLAVLVSAERQLAYDLKNTVTAERQLLYTITTTVTATRQLAYNMLSTITAERQLAYNMLNSVAATRVVTYDTGALVAAARVVSYDIEALASSERVIAYDLGDVTASLVLLRCLMGVGL